MENQEKEVLEPAPPSEPAPALPSPPPPPAEKEDDRPVLKTLSPALRKLESCLRDWLNTAHSYPCPSATRTTLESLAADLHRQADALDADRPLLTIMLMGGTGVGKSTLLNALAGGSIAQASYARPTTRDPVVYFHITVKPDRLDPALQHCRFVQHDRPALEQKIIVDTPDVDSMELANREKLFALLPVADVVLYVGSQEKYHDKLIWDLFLQQRQRRAFAFILNKWDRCLHAGASGLRPDQDLLSDLKALGFKNPLLFRTNAQFWVDQDSGAVRQDNGQAADKGPVAAATHTSAPPEGEQFTELTHWLEMGLSQMEIEAIKARGVSQLLAQLQTTLVAASPPDLTDVASRTQSCWGRILRDEAAQNAAILLNTLEPYQKEIEHHFALQRQGRFRGLMASYLHFFNRMRYAGSSLRDRIPFLPRTSSKVDTPAAWDLSTFTRACSSAASDRHLDARNRALANRLLVEADQQGFPLSLLSEPTETTAKIDWRGRYAQALVEVLGQVEHEWTRPKGVRFWIQGMVVFLADWLPLLTVGVVAAVLLWGWIVQDPARPFHWGDLFLIAAALLMVLIILHVLIAIFMPLRWQAIRGEFHRQLERRLHEDLEKAYASVPGEVAQVLKAERQQMENLVGEVRDVTSWLEKREQAASITAMYGK